MPRVTIDAVTKARLQGLREPTEFADESGEILGHFVPMRQDEFRPHPADQCPYPAEELKRFKQEKGGITLEEVLKGVPPK